ncbi:MAG: COQ9 family protein [Proteobacteria bacterium]|nr:COQ9 family protein [Pseudomonadota bacterium]
MTRKHPTAVRDEERRRLLAATLDQVAFNGWTVTALRAGAADLALDLADVARLFPGGSDEAVRLFVDEADRRMVEELARRQLGNMRHRDRIATAVRVRLEQHALHREAVRRALALQALPQNGPGGLASLYRTVDAMWHAAGDTSTDFSFYTKRLLLSGVYVSTLMFWLNDKSEDSQATWAFLDRRIEDVMQIQNARARLERYLPDTERILGSPPGAFCFALSLR